jgi:hypothetical protein
MDPVQIRIDAEVDDALNKVLRLRSDFVKFKDEYKKAVSEMAAVNNKFSGDQLTRTATQYMKSLAQLGDIQKLTNAEQAKVNKVLTEAAEKYVRLGRDVPEAMQKIIAATSQAAIKQQEAIRKTTEGVSGEKAIRDANLYVQAIQRVGDVNRLTEAQQQKVNKTLGEALDAFRRLGIQAPAEMQKIFDATTKAKPAADELRKLREALSGDALTRQVAQYAKVVTDLGGVSKLSVEEQRKFLAILDQVDKKSAAMGKTMPADWRAIQTELKKLAPLTGELKKLDDALSGRNVISGANNYISVINRIGGAHKLTKEEQEKANKVLTEAAAKYRALGQQVPGDMQRILDATKANTDKSRGFFNGLWFDIAKGSAVGNLVANAITGAFRRIDDAITGTIKLFAEFIDRGSRVDRIQGAFEKLVPGLTSVQAEFKNVSSATEGMIAAAQRGTKGLATNFEIMKAANQAILFGLPLSTKEFEVLARAAVTLGRAMDLSAGRALNDLIVALGRSSPRILDNLGIIVKMIDANAKYAASIGKNRLELTAEERTLAFYRESMTKMGAKVEEIGEIHLTARDKYDKARVSLQNIIDTQARLAAQSAVLNRAIEGVGEIIASALGNKSLDTTRLMMNAISTGTVMIVTGFKAAVVAAGSLATALIYSYREIIKFKFEAVVMAESLTGLLVRVADLAKFVPGMGDQFKNLAIASGLANLEIKKLMGTPLELGTKLAMTTRDGNNVIAMFQKMEGQANDLIKELSVLAALDPLKNLRKSSENLPLIVSNDQANADADAPMSKAEAARIKQIEAFNIAWDKEQAKTRAAYEAALKWYQGWLNRQDKLIDKQNEQTLKRLETQNTNAAIKQFEATTGMLAEIDRMHAGPKGHMPIMDQIKAWGTFSRDIGVDASKFFMGPFEKAMQKVVQGIPQLISRIARPETILGQFGSVIGGAYGEQLFGAQGTVGKGMSRMLSKLPIGDGLKSALGAAMPVVGAMMGQLAGVAMDKFIEVLRKPGWKDTIKVVAREWGVTISEELAKAIEATSKEKFRGDRRSAELFHFSDILKEAGGVTEENFEQMLAQLRVAFSMIDMGKFTVTQARQVLDQNFQLFADHLTKSGKLASDSLLEFIALNQRFKTESQAIEAFYQTNAKKFGAALSTMATDAAERFKDLDTEIKAAADAVVDANKAIEASEEKEGATYEALIKKREELVAAHMMLLDKQRQGAVGTQEEFDRLGRLAVAAAGNMAAQGATTAEIQEALGPALQRLVDLQRALGLATQNTTLQELLQLQNARNLNKAIFEGADAVNEATVAAFNMGSLTQETFSDLEDQMQVFFVRLQSTGITQRDVIQQNLPFLQTALDLERRRGFVLDETTQIYIDQAREFGLLTGVTESGTDVMREGFHGIHLGLMSIVEALGGVIPDALRRMVEAATGASEDTEDGLGDVGDAASGVEDQLGNLIGSFEDIQRQAKLAAREGVDALIDIGRAADDATHRVYGVSFGQSPGGFRSIIETALSARDAVATFADDANPRIQELIDRLRLMDPSLYWQNLNIAQPGGVVDPSTEFINELRMMRADIHALRSNIHVVINGTILQDGEFEGQLERHTGTVIVRVAETNRDQFVPNFKRAMGIS